MTAPGDGPLLEALRSSQRLGMLGPQPVERAVDHAEAFVEAVAPVAGTVIDLGSGGGLPGLVIAWRRRDLRLVLVERRTSRADHLRRLVRTLALDGHVEVLAADVIDVVVGPAQAVVARSFGSPAVTATAAAPLLEVGGRLVVSEPPHEDVTRWPASLLGVLGLRQLAHHDRRVMIATRVPDVPRETTVVPRSRVSRETEGA